MVVKKSKVRRVADFGTVLRINLCLEGIRKTWYSRAARGLEVQIHFFFDELAMLALVITYLFDF